MVITYWQEQNTHSWTRMPESTSDQRGAFPSFWRLLLREWTLYSTVKIYLGLKYQKHTTCHGTAVWYASCPVCFALVPKRLAGQSCLDDWQVFQQPLEQAELLPPQTIFLRTKHYITRHVYVRSAHLLCGPLGKKDDFGNDPCSLDLFDRLAGWFSPKKHRVMWCHCNAFSFMSVFCNTIDSRKKLSVFVLRPLTLPAEGIIEPVRSRI